MLETEIELIHIDNDGELTIINVYDDFLRAKSDLYILNHTYKILEDRYAFQLDLTILDTEKNQRTKIIEDLLSDDIKILNLRKH